MSPTDAVWVGADPGGRGNFGVCILNSNGLARTRLVDCADDAIAWVGENAELAPSGVGVDAPLWWSSGRSGDRRADQWLRMTYGFSGGQVQTTNSLRGAALVQGAMFVQRVRERYGEVRVTETHPKALLQALRSDWGEFCDRFGLTGSVGSEHERDAVVSAVAAREGFEGRWTIDLSLQRHASEQDPSRFWLAPVHYFWPEF